MGLGIGINFTIIEFIENRLSNKIEFTYCGAVLEKFNDGHLINCYTENVSLKTGYYADHLSF